MLLQEIPKKEDILAAEKEFMIMYTALPYLLQPN